MILRRSRRALGIALAGLASFAAARAAPEDAEPVDVGAETAIEVRLVTVDVVVVDERGRTVADLEPGDFVMKVDGDVVAVDTFDRDCPGGASDDATARRRLGDARPSETGDTAPRRIVLAIDYYHLSPLRLTEVFDNLRSVLETGFSFDDEFMVVAFANGLRMEQPFTSDRRGLLDALRRMEVDVSLWNGHFDHTTERPTFAAFQALLEVLAGIESPKAVVLFSDGVWPGSGSSLADFNFDVEFRRLAAMAGNGRVAIYPVLASGMSKPPG